MSRNPHGLGRVLIPDERDRLYLMRSVLPRSQEFRPWVYRYPNGWWGDQGSRPHCVAYAWLHWVEDGPIAYPERHRPGVLHDPARLYHKAQQVDQWPGDSYDGTSVRAGADVLRQMGLISNYYWAYDIETVLQGVELLGPVVMGTNWYGSMFSPDSEGRVWVGGSIAGGHAWIINGFNRNTGLVRCKNSWGRGWGKAGYFYLSFDDLARLISEHGEACCATEVRRAA